MTGTDSGGVREEIVAQIPVVSAAWRFIIPALRDDDFAAAWSAWIHR